MSTKQKIFDPDEVERAVGRALPRVRHLAWALVDRDGAVELLMATAEVKQRWAPVRVPAALVVHLEALVLHGLDNLDARLEMLEVDDEDRFVAAELAGYQMLMTAGSDELWISVLRDGREIASTPWRYAGDFYGVLASARIMLMHHGLLQPAGPAN